MTADRFDEAAERYLQGCFHRWSWRAAVQEFVCTSCGLRGEGGEDALLPYSSTQPLAAVLRSIAAEERKRCIEAIESAAVVGCKGHAIDAINSDGTK